MSDGACVSLAPMARLKWDRKDGCHMLLSPERGLVLNETAKVVVDLCDGTREATQIIAECVGRFGGASPERIDREVRALLTELRARALIVGYSDP